MKSSDASHAWQAARICRNLWLESRWTEIARELGNGNRRRSATCAVNNNSLRQSKRPLANFARTTHQHRTSTTTTQPAQCTASPPLFWNYLLPCKKTASDRYTSIACHHPRNSHSSSSAKPAAPHKDTGVVLSAALEQSAASTAQSLIDIMFHALRKLNNPLLAWECYSDLTLRGMLHYISRDQFRELIRLFRHHTDHVEGLEYVLTLVEDMKNMGHRVSRKEKLTIMQLLGMNGKLTEVEHIFRELVDDENLLIVDGDVQKPFNILLTAYQLQKDRVGRKRVTEKSLEIYDEMLMRGVSASTATTRLLMENVRLGGYSLDMVELVWEWFWSKVGKSVGSTTVQLPPLLYREMLLYFAGAGRVEYALEVNDMMVKMNMKRDVHVMTALIHKVGRSGDIDKAMEILHEMTVTEHIAPTLVTFNALIDIHAHKRPEPDVEGASRMYNMLQDSGLKADVMTFGPLIDMFAITGDLNMVRRLYRDMVDNHKLTPTAHIFSSLITCFIRNDDWESALDVLRVLRDTAPYSVSPNHAIYGLLIRSYVENRDAEGALRLIELMKQADITPDAQSFTPLLGLLADEGDVYKTKKIIDYMIEAGIEPNAYTYTCLLEAYAKAGDIESAERVFTEFRRRWRPNAHTFNSMLYVYTKCGEMEMVLDTYKRMLKTFIKMNVYTYGILMYYFSRRKEPRAVEALLETMLSNQIKPSVQCWNIMMQGYFECGRYEDGTKILERMTEAGVEPDHVTLSILVTGSVRAGRLSLAESVVQDAVQRTQTEQENREKALEEQYADYERWADAKAIAPSEAYHKQLPLTIDDILDMRRVRLPPVKIPPPHLFSPLINAYTTEKRFDDAKKLFQEMVQLGVSVTVPVYVSLMKMYRQEERYDIVEIMWNALRNKGQDQVVLNDLDPQLQSIPMPVSGKINLDVLDTLMLKSYEESSSSPNAPEKVASPFALSIYIDALIQQQRFDDLVVLWSELSAEQYPFDDHNWNRYIVALIEAERLDAARETATRFLESDETSRLSRSRSSDDVHTRLHMRTCRAFADALAINAENLSEKQLRQAVVERL